MILLNASHHERSTADLRVAPRWGFCAQRFFGNLHVSGGKKSSQRAGVIYHTPSLQRRQIHFAICRPFFGAQSAVRPHINRRTSSLPQRQGAFLRATTPIIRDTHV